MPLGSAAPPPAEFDQWPVEGSHLEYYIERLERVPASVGEESNIMDVKMVYTKHQWVVDCVGQYHRVFADGTEESNNFTNQYRAGQLPARGSVKGPAGAVVNVTNLGVYACGPSTVQEVRVNGVFPLSRADRDHPIWRQQAPIMAWTGTYSNPNYLHAYDLAWDAKFGLMLDWTFAFSISSIQGYLVSTDAPFERPTWPVEGSYAVFESHFAFTSDFGSNDRTDATVRYDFKQGQWIQTCIVGQRLGTLSAPVVRDGFPFPFHPRQVRPNATIQVGMLSGCGIGNPPLVTVQGIGTINTSWGQQVTAVRATEHLYDYELWGKASGANDTQERLWDPGTGIPISWSYEETAYDSHVAVSGRLLEADVAWAQRPVGDRVEEVADVVLAGAEWPREGSFVEYRTLGNRTRIDDESQAKHTVTVDAVARITFSSLDDAVNPGEAWAGACTVTWSEYIEPEPGSGMPRWENSTNVYPFNVAPFRQDPDTHVGDVQDVNQWNNCGHFTMPGQTVSDQSSRPNRMYPLAGPESLLMWHAQNVNADTATDWYWDTELGLLLEWNTTHFAHINPNTGSDHDGTGQTHGWVSSTDAFVMSQ